MNDRADGERRDAAVGDQRGDRALLPGDVDPRQRWSEQAQAILIVERSYVTVDDACRRRTTELGESATAIRLVDGADLLPGGLHQLFLVLAHDAGAKGGGDTVAGVGVQLLHPLRCPCDHGRFGDADVAAAVKRDVDDRVGAPAGCGNDIAGACDSAAYPAAAGPL